MTAVATFPSQRAGWPNTSQSTLPQVPPDDVTRLFMPRKSSQRGAPQATEGSGAWNGSQLRSGTAGHDGGQAGSVGNFKSKKTTRGAGWPPKGDMRGQGISAHSSSSSLSPTPSVNGIHQPTPILPSQHRGTQPSPLTGSDHNGLSYLMLLPLNHSFETKLIPLPYFPETLRIGRQTNAKTLPNPSNGYFDSKVLSRQHAEVWAEPKTGKVWIRDVKSSNGTFVNGTRLSQENRDSEPHELRAEDILELGIDIFSEDNKSIIHHKVASRVEHAGFQTGQMNMDLNALADIDPIMGGGLISPQLNPVNNFVRGRSTSQNSRVGSVAGVAGVLSRGVPMFMQSASIEQIVKRLNSELHLAKQQAQDLQRTQELFDHLLNLEVVRNEPDIKKAEVLESAGHSPIIDSGVALEASQFQKMPHHPLPPPAKHITVVPESDRLQEEPKALVKNVSPPSPKRFSLGTAAESPQHLFSLITQLRDARSELEAKSARVKDLEDLLRREREAREIVEAQLEKASYMAGHSPGVDREDIEDIPDDISVTGSEATVVASRDAIDDRKHPQEEAESAAVAAAAATAASEAAVMWQKRVEAMMAELQSAKAEIERYKKRVRTAEEDGEHSRRTLMEMIAKIRADEEKRQRREMKEMSVQTEKKNSDGPVKNNPTMVSCGVQAGLAGNASTNEVEVVPDTISSSTVNLPHGVSVMSREQQLQGCYQDCQQFQSSPTGMVKTEEKRSMMKESVPYVSIVGVVVIGVSIMAILNNWQKGER